MLKPRIPGTSRPGSGTRTPTTIRTSIRPAKLKDFLEQLANLKDEPVAFERLWRRFGQSTGTQAPQSAFLTDILLLNLMQWLGDRPEERETQVAPDRQPAWADAIRWLRDAVRFAWEAADSRTAQWRIVRLLGILGEEIYPGAFLQAPPPTPFEEALLYMLEFSHKLKRCGNPDCRVRPYFFAAHGGTKHCSERCGDRGQAIAKLNWWREHGKAWRNQAKKARAV